MKKLLLASTALVFSAAVANAQAVSIGGEGRMGIMGTDSGAGWNWAQENRLQFNFSVSVEADHGLTFGAFSRARMTNGATGVFSGSRVWVESNGLRLTFGNTFWPTGKNYPCRLKLSNMMRINIKRVYLAIDTALAHPARYQLSVLRTKIYN